MATNSERITVLQLGNPGILYGAERWILALAAKLDRDQFETIVAAINDEDGPEPAVCNAAREMGLDSVSIDAPGRLNYAAVRQLRHLIVSAKVDVVHSHGYKTDIVSALAVRRTQAKLVCTPHGWSTDAGLKLAVYEFLNRVAFYFADVVAPLSAALRDGLRQWPGIGKKLCLIRNGVDIETIDEEMAAAREAKGNETSGDRFVVGYIGQLIERKRLDTLLRAFSKMTKSGKQLLLVGDGEQKSHLMALATELGCAADVVFTGYRTDRLALLSSFDVFVLPSALEGIPRCLLEAMAAGISVVSSDIPGSRDIVTDGETGRLFELGDDQALASILDSVAGNPHQYRDLADAGRQLIRSQYSAVDMGRKYAKLFHALKHKSDPWQSEIDRTERRL